MYACVGVGLVYAHIKKTHGDARSLQAVIQCDLSEINVYPLNNITHLCTVLYSNKNNKVNIRCRKPQSPFWHTKRHSTDTEMFQNTGQDYVCLILKLNRWRSHESTIVICKKRWFSELACSANTCAFMCILLTGHWFGRRKRKQGGNAFETIYNVVLKTAKLV